MLILYSTLGCHLCDDAKAIIEASGLNINGLKIIDIADDDALVEKYGVRIPVLRKETSGEELGWPFDIQGFSAWYNE